MSQLKEILIKNWMTHDAMWFYHCLQACGIETTNQINRAAVKSMAHIEVKRICKLLEISSVNDFEQFKSFVDGAYSIVKADFMKFDHSFESPSRFRMVMKQCFAYDGIKKVGMIDTYECGIFARVEGWLEALNICYQVTPKVRNCMMHEEGSCHREYQLIFTESVY